MELNDLTMEELSALYYEYEQTHKSEFFSPYPFQTKMFEAGNGTIARYACLANRIGKTYSGAMEMSYHLTGQYPTVETHGWEWTGRRFDRPIKAWAIGITNDSTRKVLQQELLGTIDVRDGVNLGKGSIPLNTIDTENLEREGPCAKVVRVKHVSGGESILEFRSTQQGTHVLMGVAQDYIWLDEESPHQALEIFSQCSTRLATTNGSLLITATPENGLSSLIQHFYDSEDLFIFHAGWDDAPHLSDEIKSKLLATYPEWEVELRTKGFPSKGSGAIFQVEDSFIESDELFPQPHWPVVAGIDFGRSKDPSTVVFATKNPETDVIHIFREYYLDKDRSPEAIAETILSSGIPNIPVIPPHDGNSVSTDGGSETRAAIMRRLGCNVPMVTFSNPPEVQNTISNVNKKHMGKEGGLAWMAYLFKQGKLKVCKDLSYFFKEKRSYFYITKGGKTQPKDGNDHIIDAARIAVLSLDRFGSPLGQCLADYTDFNNGFTQYEDVDETSWY